MCTVTYIKNNNCTIITSNRDEAVNRITLTPQIYTINDKKIIFPKDTKANGTWFAVSEEGTTAVLLNGAKERHIRTNYYRRSRGLILLDILSAANPLHTIETINLKEIEPFTLILSTGKLLHQFRWDGNEKELLAINPLQNYIWASSTLYSDEVRVKREKSFNDFTSIKRSPSQQEMMDFHQFTESDDSENGFIINRSEILKTVSITQCIAEENKRSLIYEDLITKKTSKEAILIL